MNNPRIKRFLSVILSISLISCTSPKVESSEKEEPPPKPVATETNVQPTEEAKVSQTPQVTLTAAPSNWREKNHIHSIKVAPHNPNHLYVATHHGILLRNDEGEWFQVGTNRSDFMSFVAHPTDDRRFYGSGHPPTGGNMGFIFTEDGGENWLQKSLPGVDFHALAIAPSNPDIFYGWVASSTKGEHGLLWSSDGGKSWQEQKARGLREHPFGLAVAPHNSAHLFATTRGGVYESNDAGNTWTIIPSTKKAPIAGLVLVAENDKTIMYGYQVLNRNQGGIVRSQDNGKTWSAMGTEPTGIIFHLTHAPSHPQILYAANDKNIIFQSLDGGKSWKELN
ncbi:MAG: F510_1955 family glycosylhydrolase [Xenococcaceae cyanobacterium]